MNIEASRGKAASIFFLNGRRFILKTDAEKKSSLLILF